MNNYKTSLVSCVVLFAFLFSLHPVLAQTHRPKYNVSMIPNSGGYYEYLPEGYDSSTTVKHPVIIFIHGVYEKGDGSTSDLPLIVKFGLPKYIRGGYFPKSFTVNGKTEKFVVISPQFKSSPSSGDINGVINYVLSKYRVNPNKVYLTGLSMGGGATWNFGANSSYNSKIAAMVPICGSASPSASGGARIAEAGIAVWATHNRYDVDVSSSKTINWVNYVNAANPIIPAKISLWSSSSHDAWSRTYKASYRENGKNIYEWMLQFERGGTLPPNQTPVANAGADKSLLLPVSSVTLTGSGTDPDGTIASYAWSKVAGPTGSVFSSLTVASPVVTGLVAGTHTFRLTVKDNKGAIGFDDVNVVVSGIVPNTPPQAIAGPDQTVTLSGGVGVTGSANASLTGSGVDTDGSIVKYSWTKLSGPSQGTIATPTAATTTVSNLIAGSYSFRLTVTDDDSATATDDVVVVVTTPPPPPAVTNKAINVRIFGGTNPYTNPEWNNWNVSSSLTSSALKYNDASVSSISAALSQSNGVQDNGASYGGTMCPPEVLRYTSSSGVTRTLTLSGLNPSKTYSLELYASRGTSGNSTQFTVDGVVQSIATYNNLTSKAVFNNLLPSGAGTIIVTIANAQTYNYINGFTLTEVKKIKANLFGGANSYTNAEWNNWNVVSSLSSSALKYSDASVSSISAALSQSNGVQDNGASYGGTMCPPEVLRYTSSSGVTRTLTLSGLNPSKTYSLELYASRGTSGNSTQFTVDGVVQSIATYNNLTSKAVFNNLLPSPAGTIVVTIANEQTYNYINGFTITEGAGGGSVTVPTTTITRTVAGAETAETAISVFPNPIQDKFALKVTNALTGVMIVQMIDESGIVKKQFSLNKSSVGTMQTYLSVGTLPSGNYSMKVQMGDWVEVQNVVKN